MWMLKRGRYCGRKKPRRKSYERLWGGHKHEPGSRKTCIVDFALLWSGWNGQISSSLSPSFPVRTVRGLVWRCISLLELLKSLIRIQDSSQCVWGLGCVCRFSVGLPFSFFFKFCFLSILPDFPSSIHRRWKVKVWVTKCTIFIQDLL